MATTSYFQLNKKSLIRMLQTSNIRNINEHQIIDLVLEVNSTLDTVYKIVNMVEQTVEEKVQHRSRS